MGVFEIFDWIYTLEKERELLIIEEVTNSQNKRNVQKKDSGLHFSLSMCNYSSKLLFFEESKFIIKDGLFEIRIKHYQAENTNIISQRAECKAYIFESKNFEDNGEKFYHYYSKIDDSFLIYFMKDFNREISTVINEIKFVSTILRTNDLIFLCIQCEKKIEYKKFKHSVNNIIVSIGFVTGEFYKLEEFYFQSEQNSCSEHVEFFYRNGNEYLGFPFPFTNAPSRFEYKFKGQESENKAFDKCASYVDEVKFNKLVNLLILKPRIYFAIKILFNFNKYPAISRVSLMFVVLETICEEFKKNLIFENVEVITIKEKGTTTIEKIKDRLSDKELEALKELVDNIDVKLTSNMKNFETVFKGMTLKLNNDELKILKNRNHFFHGRIIPENIEIDSEEAFEDLENNYIHISFRLYVLSIKLILKKIGFSGFIINYPKLFDVDNKLKESYFIELK